MSNISYRYSYALFDLCKEEKNINNVYNDFTDLISLLDESSEFDNVLSSETILKDEKKSIVIEVFKKIENNTLKNFLLLLIDKNRINLIRPIYSDFKELYLGEEGVLTVVAKSTFKLDDKLKENLTNKLKNKFNKDIILTNEIDESIIGGLVLFINNEMIDLSIKNQLDNLKKQLLEASIV